MEIQLSAARLPVGKFVWSSYHAWMLFRGFIFASLAIFALKRCGVWFGAPWVNIFIFTSLSKSIIQPEERKKSLIPDTFSPNTFEEPAPSPRSKRGPSQSSGSLSSTPRPAPQIQMYTKENFSHRTFISF
jgi:hypothetical protein